MARRAHEVPSSERPARSAPWAGRAALVLLLALPSAAALAQGSSSASHALDGGFFSVAGGASSSSTYALQSCFTIDPSGSAASSSYSVTVGCGVTFLPRLLGPTLAKSFNPAIVERGKTSILTIALGNPNTLPIEGVTFTDSYPGTLRNGPAPGVVNTCGGLVVADPGGPSISLAGGTVPVGGCSVQVVVTSAQPGFLTNSMAAEAVQSANAWPNPQGAAAVIDVEPMNIPAASPLGLAALAGLVALAGLRSVRRRSRPGA